MSGTFKMSSIVHSQVQTDEPYLVNMVIWNYERHYGLCLVSTFCWPTFSTVYNGGMAIDPVAAFSVHRFNSFENSKIRWNGGK